MALESIDIEDEGGTARKVTVDQHDTDKYVQVVKIGVAVDGTTPTLVSDAAPFPTKDVCNAGFAITATTAGTTETALPATALTGRREMKVQNRGSGAIALIETGGSFADGILVGPGGSTEWFKQGESQVLYVIAQTDGQKVITHELA